MSDKLKIKSVDAEIWKVIEGADDYEVSTHGRVRSHRYHDGKILKKSICVTIYDNDDKIVKYRVSNLMLNTFKNKEQPNSEYSVFYIDGDRTNNHIDNIMWKPAEAWHVAKLTREQVEEIKASTEDSKGLAEKYNVSYATIMNIRSGRTWKDRPSGVEIEIKEDEVKTFKMHRKSKLTIEQIEEIKSSKLLLRELAIKYNVSLGMISHIKLNKVYIPKKDREFNLSNQKKKLTQKQIQEIVISKLSVKELASNFNVSLHTIYRYVNN